MIKLVDIAKQLKLSRVTVSAVLNDRYKSLGISEATAERVIKTARDMGYRRNEMAIAMKTGRTFLLGGMTSALSLEWGGRILEGALREIRESDYSLKVETVHNPQDEAAAVKRFIGARVAGLFACNINPKMEDATILCQQIQQYDIPMVCNNCRAELSPYQVDPDNIGGSRLAVEHLAELGHKHIAYIGGDDQSISSLQRRDGFLLALGEFGLSLGPNFLERGNWEFDETEEAVKRLLKNSKRPTALVCANDEMAAVAIRTIQRAGLSVPGDISVVGFTNERLGELCNPPLTTVSQPETAVGRLAMKLLIELVAVEPKDRPKSVTHTLPSDLIVRESTARAPRTSE